MNIAGLWKKCWVNPHNEKRVVWATRQLELPTLPQKAREGWGNHVLCLI